LKEFQPASFVAAAKWNKAEVGGDFDFVSKTLSTARKHVPEYLIEAWCLGTFMFSACTFGVLVFHPSSPAAGIEPLARGVLMGIAMGLSAILIITSPWGKRSGAHFNPSVTLAFYRLGKISGTDAAFYVLAHFIGGVIGVLLAWAIFGERLAASTVNFVVTVPGIYGTWAAAAGEFTVAFVQMTVILVISNTMRISRFTPFIAGAMVALYIAIEAPVSGMSMNPARTFASAAVAGQWDGWWIYFTAPPAAMLTAAEVYARSRGLHRVLCAKLDHTGRSRCIFKCGYHDAEPEAIEVTKDRRFAKTAAGLF
jgi:aquaporin Z